MCVHVRVQELVKRRIELFVLARLWGVGTESESVNSELNAQVCTCDGQESQRVHSPSLCPSFHCHERNVCGLAVAVCAVAGRKGGREGASSLSERGTVKVSEP